MGEKKNERQPLELKNPAALKRAIKPGVEVVATYHAKHPSLVGVRRVVTTVQTNGFYTKIKDPADPNCEKYNHGKGFRSDFDKASRYRFDGSTITVMDARSEEPRVLYKLEVYDTEQTMGEQQAGASEHPAQSAQPQEKPDCELIGQNGNIYNLMGIAYRTLRENSMEEQAKKMFERVTSCNNYYKALAIIGEYVNITGPAEPEESMTMGGM